MHRRSNASGEENRSPCCAKSSRCTVTMCREIEPASDTVTSNRNFSSVSPEGITSMSAMRQAYPVRSHAMPFVDVGDARLHVEVDGEGEPVTVLGHGLTNTCRELARITPVLPGTKVRFCFRGHGHSTSPATGYRFADFARDLDAVATKYVATRAVGTSLRPRAIARL